MPDLASQPVRWWNKWFRTPAELRELGVVGINMRNAKYLLPNNSRKLYRNVDDKLRTKSLADVEGISVPETFAVIRTPNESAKFERLMGGRNSFVIKPARGSGGKGVLVIDGVDSGFYFKPSGAALEAGDVRHHIDNILAGLFSLGGSRDVALLEYRVNPAKLLTDISYQGAPDIRIVMLHGYPVMAMLRAATKESDGRANLHQGAIGIGVDIATGKTVRAIHHGKPIMVHSDLKKDLVGIQLPDWDLMLEIAVTCAEMTGLGYLGVDLMLDEEHGPLMIEVNARPGLSIQMANGIGLMKRLEPVVERHSVHEGESLDMKIEFAKEHFRVSDLE